MIMEIITGVVPHDLLLNNCFAFIMNAKGITNSLPNLITAHIAFVSIIRNKRMTANEIMIP